MLSIDGAPSENTGVEPSLWVKVTVFFSFLVRITWIVNS